MFQLGCPPSPPTEHTTADFSAERNPSHTYYSSGTYTVTLTSTNAYGEVSTAKNDLMNVTKIIISEFMASNSEGIYGSVEY